MAQFLTQEQISEYKECFSLYDDAQRGKIRAKDLITVMRCLGRMPTLAEVERHLLVHKIGRAGELDFSTFLDMMHWQQQQEHPQQEILEAMRRSDDGCRGFIMAAELRTKLTHMGEKLTHPEVDELLERFGVGADGRVHYETVAAVMGRHQTDFSASDGIDSFYGGKSDEPL